MSDSCKRGSQGKVAGFWTTPGSGGHNTLFQILSRLERRGHVCTVWLQDDYGAMNAMWPAVIRRDIRDLFASFEGPVYKGFDDWHGADVVLATGWQTVHPALRLPGCRARAYLVNDHEPEFYGASTERLLAEDSYRHDLYCIAASPWLRDLLIDRYGAAAEAFALGWTTPHTARGLSPGDGTPSSITPARRHRGERSRRA